MKVQKIIIYMIFGLIMMIQVVFTSLVFKRTDVRAIKEPVTNPNCPEGWIYNRASYKCDIDDNLNMIIN